MHALALAASGLGVYLETTVPVALVHNQSTTGYASGASVHFDVLSPAGRVLRSSDVAVPPLGPGGDGVVAARLALSGSGNTVRARISGGTWAAMGQASPTVAASTVACAGHPCPSGPHPAVATVAGSAPLPGTVNAAAMCFDQSRRAIGGGTATITATARTLEIPLILSSTQISCVVTFSAAF